MKAFLGYGALGIQIEAFLKENDPLYEAQYFDDYYVSDWGLRWWWSGCNWAWGWLRPSDPSQRFVLARLKPAPQRLSSVVVDRLSHAVGQEADVQASILVRHQRPGPCTARIAWNARVAHAATVCRPVCTPSRSLSLEHDCQEPNPRPIYVGEGDPRVAGHGYKAPMLNRYFAWSSVIPRVSAM